MERRRQHAALSSSEKMLPEGSTRANSGQFTRQKEPQVVNLLLFIIIAHLLSSALCLQTKRERVLLGSASPGAAQVSFR